MSFQNGSEMRGRTLFFAACFLAALAGAAFAGVYDYGDTEPPPDTTGMDDVYLLPGAFNNIKVRAGKWAILQTHNLCAKIHNVGASDIFVPALTAAEYSGFLSASPGVSLTTCANGVPTCKNLIADTTICPGQDANANATLVASCPAVGATPTCQATCNAPNFQYSSGHCCWTGQYWDAGSGACVAGYNFLEQNAEATRTCSGNTATFEATINIVNSSWLDASFLRTGLTGQGSAPVSFTVFASTTKAVNFGTLTSTGAAACPATPGAGNVGGSATYRVTQNGTVVDTVTYSWEYPVA